MVQYLSKCVHVAKFCKVSPFNTLIKRHQKGGSLIDILIQVKSQFNSHDLGLMYYMLRSIWGDRNKVLFWDSKSLFSVCYEWVKGYNKEFMKSCNSTVDTVAENFIFLSHRAFVLHSQLKLRSDTAFKLGQENAELGVTIRDNNELVASTWYRYIEQAYLGIPCWNQSS